MDVFGDLVCNVVHNAVQKRGRMRPPFFGQEKNVVTQVVVGVGCENVEHNPFPEFKKVLFGRCSGRLDEGGDFGVSAVFVSVSVAEQGHC